MIEFDSYAAYVKKLDVVLSNGETLEVSYAPSKITTKYWIEITKEGSEVTEADVIAHCVTEWSFAAKGKRIPVTAQFLNEKISAFDRKAIFKALSADINPTPADEAQTD